MTVRPIAPWISALMVALAVMSGCSTVRIGYDQLDTIAVLTADRYFDLDERQKKEFSARFRGLHEWHRYEQLPDYAAFLTLAKARLARGLDAGDVHWFTEGIKQRYAIIANRGAKDAAAILLTVTPRQLEAAQERWGKVNRRFASENEIDSSLEEQRRASSRRTIEIFRDWFGSLSDDQERMVRAAGERMEMIGPLRHQDRLRRQREFVELMRLRAEPETFSEKLRLWLVHWDAGRLPEYQRAFALSRDQRIALLIAMDRSLAPHQRAAALRRLQGYIDDIRALADRPRAQATAGP
jgi:hypothetical protein